MSSVLKRDFTKWPNHLFRCPDLSANGRLVALSLLRYADDDGLCWPSQQTIADDTGIGRKAVNQAVNELRRFKLRSSWERRPGAALKCMHYNVSELRHPSKDEAAAKCRCGNHSIHSIGKTQRGGVSKRHSVEFQNDTLDCVETTHYTDTVKKNHLNSVPALPSLEDSDVYSVPVQREGSGELASAIATAPGIPGCQAQPASAPTSGSDAYAGGMVEKAPPGANTVLDRSAVHNLRLAPAGHSFDGATDPEQDAREILALVGGESPNPGALDTFDFERVWFHAQWLPRRIAFECERTGKPVARPTALLMTAIRKDLPIQTNWPEYDFEQHGPQALGMADLDHYVRLFRQDKTKGITSELLGIVCDLAAAQVVSEVDADSDLPF